MKKIIFLFLIIGLLCPVRVLANDANVTPNAKSAILVEATTGKVLYNKDANMPHTVASLTKMMGLIIFFETLEKGGISLDEQITVSENAKNMGGTQLWLDVGEKISVKDLIKGIVMASANDAMVALAERLAGTEEAFVKMMNDKAKSMNLKSTNFKNVTGLDEDGHISSAYDMALIAMELLKHKNVLEFTSVYEDYVREGKNKTWISNSNKLVRFYEGADGLKTGYETSAGSCLAATAKRGDLRLIAIVLGYEKSNVRNKEAMDLLDYGFNQYEAKPIYKKGDIVGSTKLDKASDNKLNLVISEDLVSIKKKTEKDVKYTYETKLNDLVFPIEKDTIIGSLIVKEDGNLIREIPLLAEKYIGKAEFFKMFLTTIKNIITVS